MKTVITFNKKEYTVEVEGGDVRISNDAKVIATGFWDIEESTVIDCRGESFSAELWTRIDRAIDDLVNPS